MKVRLKRYALSHHRTPIHRTDDHVKWHSTLERGRGVDPKMCVQLSVFSSIPLLLASCSESSKEQRLNNRNRKLSQTTPNNYFPETALSSRSAPNVVVHRCESVSSVHSGAPDDFPGMHHHLVLRAHPRQQCRTQRGVQSVPGKTPRSNGKGHCHRWGVSDPLLHSL